MSVEPIVTRPRWELRCRAGGRPVGFAHRGGGERRHDQNSLETFTRALSKGASGIESDVWLTRDDVPVLHHPLLPWQGLRIRRTRFADLPSSIVSLQSLYEHCGTDFELALDMPMPTAASRVVAIAEAYAGANRLWLTHWRLATLVAWRRRWPRLHLVMPSMTVRGMVPGRRIAALRDASVDVLNLYQFGVTARVVEAAHNQGVGLFAWGVDGERTLERVLAAGADGVFSNRVPQMMSAISRQVTRQAKSRR